MIKALSTILLSALVFVGCQSTFEPAIPASPQKLVVDSQFSPGNPWVVKLTHSRDLLSAQEFDVVSNASVEIFSGNDLVKKLSYVDPGIGMAGFYFSNDSYPEIGREYTLKVSAPDYPSITATDAVPGLDVEIGLFEFLHKSEDGDDVFSLNLQDLNPGANYYHVIVMVQSYEFANLDVDSSLVLVDQNAARFGLKEDESSHNSGNEDIFTIRDSKGLLLSDIQFDQGMRNVELEVFSQNFSGDYDDHVLAYVVELRSVSEAYFEFERTKAEQINQGNSGIFFPVEIESNIEGGLGIFSGFSVVNSAVIWQE